MMKNVLNTFVRAASSRACSSTVVLFSMLIAASALAQSYAWKNVAIKGGGFVSGIITHPNAPGVVYCRTDIGGAYRWNPTNNSWIPLLDFAPDANIYGVESLALDPSDGNRLYIAASRGSPAALLVSTNRGATFTTFTPPFSLNGNAEGRSAGERMAVDPNANNILFYGTRDSRLFRSVNYGANWTQLSFPVTSTSNGVGLVFIEFIKESGTPGSATPTLFVGVSQGGTNLFRSTDGGVTWTNVPTGAPASQMPHHAAQDGLGNMYVTFNNAPGPNGIGSGSVRKFNLATLVSSSRTPPTGQGGFAGVSVSRQNPLLVAVSTMNRWGPAPPADLVYRSFNGGTNWTATMSAQPSTASAPWSVARNSHWAGDVEIDPSNSNRAWFITGYGVIGCTNFASAVPANWAFTSDGIEETVPLGLASPPSGPFLLSGHGDIGGFRHFNLDVSPPLADYFNTHRGTSYGIDFAENNPSRIARLYANSPHGAYSGNGGSTWQDFSNIPAEVSGNNNGNVAISADGSRIVWMPAGTTNGAYFSTNNGINWALSTGGPTGSRFPFSDRVNSNKFYIYSSSSGGRFYISTNGGASFTLGAAIPGNGTGPRAVFGREGHIWLARGNNGMWRSTNSGVSFTAVPSVQRVSYVSFGKAAVGQSYPAIFISGRVGGVDGIYRSDNEGGSWIRINDAQNQFGLSWVHVFCADPRVFGRVYFGTEGRGIIYGELANVPPAAPADLSAVGANTQVILNWSGVSGADSYSVKRAMVGGGPYTVLTNGLTQTTYMDTGLVNGTTYYYVVSGTNSFGEGPDSNEASAIPGEPQPTALYAFEGNALDTGGNGNNGTAVGVSYVTGKVGAQAAQFNGTSAYVQIPRSITSDFTVAMWLKTTDTAGAAGAQWWSGKGLVDGEINGAAADWGTAVVNGKFVLGVGNVDVTVSSTTTVNDGTWHHVAATRNNTSGTMAVYVDGVLRGSGTGPTGTRTAPPVLRIGSLQTGNNFLNGTIDDVRLYNRVLTPPEIAALITPPVPTILFASAGDGLVMLDWTDSTAATGYHVKRATTSGGAYTIIATNSASNVGDTGLTNGTVYYYVVSAFNAVGESTNSAEASARPVSMLLTEVGFAVANGQIQLTWPPDHTGWQLQAQTNAPGEGLGTNWVILPGSALTNQFSLPIDSSGSVFFRLSSP